MRYASLVTGVTVLILLLLTPLAASSADPYWSRPVKGLHTPPDGTTETQPGRYYPKSCAACHAGQFEDWSSARHARSVGVGLMAQLDPDKPGFAASCYRCHAPLKAQAAALASGPDPNRYAANPGFDEGLKGTGVNCAVCHLRDGIIYGPRHPAATNGAHKSAQNKLFSGSEFCAACHQLDSGYKLGGKPLMNTVAEWTKSGYAEKNVTCQGCHMPGGRHLFKGIHDPAMVKSGIDIVAKRLGGDRLRGARLKITNSAVGHMFPTYVTPAVEIRGSLVDSSGVKITKSIKKAVIGRRVELDLSRELFDTRIAPGESFSFDYDPERRPGAKAILLEVWVFPDEFYNRFFSSLLKDSPEKAGLAEALSETESGYLLYTKEFDL